MRTNKKGDDLMLNAGNSQMEMDFIKSDVVENKVILEGPIKLRVHLGILSSVAVIIGSIIGSGIFVGPKGVTMEVRSLGASLVLWLAGGIFTLLGAYSYAELGCLINDSGADYSYMRIGLGDCAGFLRLWTDVIIVRPCSLAVMALAFAGYVIEPIFPRINCEACYNSGYLNIATKCMAASCLIFLGAVNCLSSKLASWLHNIFTIGKLLAIAFIIISGLTSLGIYGSSNFDNMFEGSATSLTRYVVGFYSSLFSYSGWSFLNYMVEEMINPIRDLPRAIVFATVIVTVLYILTILAYVSVISIPEMITTQSVGSLFASRLYGKAAFILPVFVVMSTFGSVNGGLLTASRLCFVGARQGHFPAFFNTIQRQRITPTPAVLFTVIMSLVFLISDDIYLLIGYIGFSSTLMHGLSVLTLFIFRKTMPHAERPIKVSLIWPAIYVIITAIILIYALAGDLENSLISLGLVFLGVPVYIFTCLLDLPMAVQKIIFNVNTTLQKVCGTIPEKLKL